MTRDDIIAEARSWIGTPYRHQASLKGVGCDCLGLVRGVGGAIAGAEAGPGPDRARRGFRRHRRLRQTFRHLPRPLRQ